MLRTCLSAWRKATPTGIGRKVTTLERRPQMKIKKVVAGTQWSAVLELHQKWLANAPDGERADLTTAVYYLGGRKVVFA